MAMTLWRHLSVASETNAGGTLKFRRRDCEAVKMDIHGFDWGDIISRSDRLILKVIKKLLKRFSANFVRKLCYDQWSSLRKRLLRKAICEFSKYEQVDSDRLHGVILAHLLQKDTICRDNSYGKIRNYMQAWY